MAAEGPPMTTHSRAMPALEVADRGLAESVLSAAFSTWSSKRAVKRLVLAWGGLPCPGGVPRQAEETDGVKASAVDSPRLWHQLGGAAGTALGVHALELGLEAGGTLTVAKSWGGGYSAPS